VPWFVLDGKTPRPSRTNGDKNLSVVASVSPKQENWLCKDLGERSNSKRHNEHFGQVKEPRLQARSSKWGSGRNISVPTAGIIEWNCGTGGKLFQRPGYRGHRYVFSIIKETHPL
jgi:hypothetical protein